jgi:hypothetical protein
MMEWNARGRETGLSVVEVLVAIVILSFVMAWNAQMAENVLRTDERARLTMASSSLALAKAEEFRRTGYPLQADETYEEDVIRDGVKYTWTARIEPAEDSNLATLAISVNWKKGNRTGSRRTFYTHLRKQ